ncbi:hypothetical protein T12_13753, partial [Trichinella patagoniensis]
LWEKRSASILHTISHAYYSVAGYFLWRNTSILSCTATLFRSSLSFALQTILHNAQRQLLHTGLFPTAQQFSFIVHRDHYSATAYFLHYTTFYFILHRCVSVNAQHCERQEFLQKRNMKAYSSSV